MRLGLPNLCISAGQGIMAQACGQGRVLLGLQAYGPSQNTVAMSLKRKTDGQEALGIEP